MNAFDANRINTGSKFQSLETLEIWEVWSRVWVMSTPHAVVLRYGGEWSRVPLERFLREFIRIGGSDG